MPLMVRALKFEPMNLCVLSSTAFRTKPILSLAAVAEDQAEASRKWEAEGLLLLRREM